MNTKYGKLISRDKSGNLTAVYPEILCDDEIDFALKQSINPVSNYVIANALEGLEDDVRNAIKNAFSSGSGGLGWDENTQTGYIDFAGLSEDEIRNLINLMIKSNGAITIDGNGKLDVDFSKLTADQLLALFINNGGVIKDSTSGKLKIDFSKLTADQLLALFINNGGIIKDSSSGKLKVDFSKMTADQLLALFNTNGGVIKDSTTGKLNIDFSKLTADQLLALFLNGDGIIKDSSSGKLKVDFSKMTADQLLALFINNGEVVKDSSSGKLKINFPKVTVNDILDISSTTGGIIASTESGSNNGKLSINFAKAPSYKGATSTSAGTPGYVPAAGVSEKDKFLKGDGTWSDGGFAHLAGAETFTGSKTFGAGLFGNATAISASAINLALGTVFTKTITASTTFTISGVPSGTAATFNLILTNGGSKVITWPSSVKWTDGTPPELTASGVDVLTFLTPDGGTTWYGCLAVNGAA